MVVFHFKFIISTTCTNNINQKQQKIFTDYVHYVGNEDITTFILNFRKSKEDNDYGGILTQVRSKKRRSDIMRKGTFHKIDVITKALLIKTSILNSWQSSEITIMLRVFLYQALYRM